MTPNENADAFFAKVHDLLDTAYTTAQGLLDGAMLVVDEFANKVETDVRAKMNGEAPSGATGRAVKVEPGFDVKRQDLKNFYADQDLRQAAGLVDRVSDNGLAPLWDSLPEQYKSYVEKDKNSPL